MFSIDVPALFDFDPWRELERVQRELNGVLGRGTGLATLHPRLNIHTNPEGAFLSALAPGLDPDKLDISVLGDTITLSGAVAEQAFPQEASYHRRERSTAMFTRTVKLPFRVDADKVRADYKNGVLELFLPRPEADKPRRVEVKVS
jgi:HSP20 family protein